MAEIEDEDRLRRRDGLDLTRLPLDPDEGQLAARLDEPMRLSDAALMMGWDVPRTRRVVRRLVEKNAVLWGEGAGDANDPYAGCSFPSPLMTAACDLSEAERKRVIWTYEKLDKWTHYDLLQAKRRDDAAAITRRFRELSLEWHPDRWRRDLGPFHRMIDAIFKRLQVARQTLCDPALREAYDEQVAHLIVDEEDLAEMRLVQRRKTRDLVRQQERLERRKRRNPVIRNLEKAKGHAAEARSLEEKGEMVEALRAAQMALTYDERNQDYQEAVDRLTELAADLRIENPMKRGRAAESLAKWDESIFFYEEAVRLAPKHAEPRKRLAYNLVMGGRDPNEALQHAVKGAEGLSNDPEAHYILGLCYDRAEMKKAAIRAFGRAVELKPNFGEAKKRLRNLRWGF
ncbi:MAG: DnaJ domain-containing protein [Myxococcota bacterium]